MLAVLPWLGATVKWFTTSTTGRVLIGALAFFTWLHFHDAGVADRARSECQAEQLQKTIAEIDRQKRAADAAVADAEKQQAVSDQELAVLQKKKDALDADIKKTRASCRLIPDEQRRRLRDIR